MTAPWFKMYRDERGSFLRLPLVARALFGEILKLTDDEGKIDLRGETPAAAVARSLGADRSDRRALRKHIPLLLEDGCLAISDGVLFAPGWSRFQPPKRARKAAEQPDAETPEATTEPRPVPRRSRDQYHDFRPKPAESLNSAPVEVEVEVEVEETQGARAEVTLRDPLDDAGQRRVPVGAFTTRLFVWGMRQVGDEYFDEMRLSGRDRERLAELTAWARTVADAHERQGRDWARAYSQALAGSLDVWVAEAQRKPGSVPLNPGGWWARRESWRQAA